MDHLPVYVVVYLDLTTWNGAVAEWSGWPPSEALLETQVAQCGILRAGEGHRADRHGEDVPPA